MISYLLDANIKKNKLFVSCIFDISHFHKLDINDININKKIANIFITTKEKNSTIKQKSSAIIGDYVLIDNAWYKVGDKYKKYKIKKIYNTYIELEFGSKIIKMQIFD
jgi:hypothetical protein